METKFDMECIFISFVNEWWVQRKMPLEVRKTSRVNKKFELYGEVSDRIRATFYFISYFQFFIRTII